MLASLQQAAPDGIELAASAGAVLIVPSLQGRIFCRLGDTLIHQFDPTPITTAAPGEFRNVGGNSLWPAPEGGDLAFNYLPQSDMWLVQPGINEAPYAVDVHQPNRVTIYKEIELTNRKGTRTRFRFERTIWPLYDPAHTQGFDLEMTGYAGKDVIEPLEARGPEELLIAPWSLEQFPGGEGVTAFVRVPEPRGSVNADFYGDPTGRLHYADGFFTFELGGPERLQIGIHAASQPKCIGAFDPARGMVMLRSTPPQPGVYFNIADNAQPGGPFSAADRFSIFNGGPLGFFELETIAPMQVDNELVARSVLHSETLVLRGDLLELRNFLKYRGITLTKGP